MPIGPTLETERLILRPPTAEDFSGFCEMMADEEAARYVGGVQVPHLVWRGLAALIGGWTLNGFSMWSIIEKSSGEWVGRLGPYFPHDWPAAEVGWGLKRSAWGKGFATEGAVAAMDFAFDTLGWTEVIHCIDPANTGSIKVAERLGSRFQREVKLPEPFDHYESHAYGQTAADWKTNRSALIKPA